MLQGLKKGFYLRKTAAFLSIVTAIATQGWGVALAGEIGITSAFAQGCLSGTVSGLSSSVVAGTYNNGDHSKAGGQVSSGRECSQFLNGLLLRISLSTASVVLAFACNICPISFFSTNCCLHIRHHNAMGSNKACVPF